MAISLNGGSNPSIITYNGNDVSEVRYNNVKVWPTTAPEPVSEDLYWLLDGNTLYLRCTNKDGYTKHDVSTYGASPQGLTGYSQQSLIKNIITEEPIYLPKYSYVLFERMNVETLDVYNWNTSKVWNAGGLFMNCFKLKSIIGLNSWNTSLFTEVSMMFEDCVSLEEINISNWDLSNVIYANKMFAHYQLNSNTKIIDLSNWNTTKLKSCAEMFRSLDKLEHIYVGDNWNLNNVMYSYYMFANCTSLPNFDNNYTDKTRAYVGTNGYLERR